MEKEIQKLIEQLEENGLSKEAFHLSNVLSKREITRLFLE